MRASCFVLAAAFSTLMGAVSSWAEEESAEQREWAKRAAEPPLKFTVPAAPVKFTIRAFHEGCTATTADGTVKWIDIVLYRTKMADGRRLPASGANDYSIRLLGDGQSGWIMPLLGPQTNQLYKYSSADHTFRQPAAKDTPADVTPQRESYCIPVNAIGQLDGVLYEVVKAEWSAADNKVVADVMVGPGKVRRRLDLWAGSDLETPKRRYRVRSVVARDGNKRLTGWIELDPFGVAIEDAKEKEQEKK